MDQCAGSIAVVIPLYNKAPWVGQTLEGVLNQSRQPDEIIVVDDGSTDEGPSIVKAMAGARVQFLRTDSPRSGPSTARNIGIRAASSEWIALLDADDLWSPEYLSKVGNQFQQHPEVGCVFSSRMILGGEKSYQHPPRQFSKVEGKLDLESYLDFWLRSGVGGLSPMHTSAAVIRKTVLEKAGLFPEAYRQGEDKDTWLRVLAVGDAHYLPEPLVSYRHDLPGQLNDPATQPSPLLAFTASSMSRSGRFSPKVCAKLQRVANRELWLYTKRRRLRPVDKAALQTFNVRRDPIRFLVMAGLYAIGLANSTWRKLLPKRRWAIPTKPTSLRRSASQAARSPPENSP